MPHVRDLMTRRIITIGADDSLHTARRLFQDHRFHHLLVMDNRKLVGVISDRDLLKTISPFVEKLAERVQDVATLNRRVHQVMTRKLITVSPDTPAEEAAVVMLDHGVSCLPVLNEHGTPVGIVTWRDMLRGVCGIPKDED